MWEFPSIRVTLFWGPLIRILLFGVLYKGPRVPYFRKLPCRACPESQKIQKDLAPKRKTPQVLAPARPVLQGLPPWPSSLLRKCLPDCRRCGGGRLLFCGERKGAEMQGEDVRLAVSIKSTKSEGHIIGRCIGRFLWVPKFGPKAPPPSYAKPRISFRP